MRKNKEVTRFNPIFDEKKPGEEGATGYSRVELPSGERRMLSEAEGNDPQLLPANSLIFAGDNITSQSMGREKGEGAASWFKVEVEVTNSRRDQRRAGKRIKKEWSGYSSRSGLSGRSNDLVLQTSALRVFGHSSLKYLGRHGRTESASGEKRSTSFKPH